VSPTSITAVLAAGASGNASVTTPGGTGIKAGFTFIPAPTIASFTPTTAAAGTTVTITGANFENASAVSFGGTAAASFNVVSPTSITAVLATGASGNVSVTTPGGVNTKAGFTFVPSPTITASGSTTFASGSNVVLTASTGTGYTYQWAKDGVDITGATNSTYTATTSGTYTTSIVLNGTNTPSNTIPVNVIYVLPVNNFNLVINSVTCKGSNNGMVSITATQALNYTATITGNNTTNSYTFTSSKTIADLAPGTYDVCITVQGQPDYQQCYAVVITEPKDLALFTSVDKNTNAVTLQLDGGSGSIYNIVLNGKTYTTANSNITLPLNNGTNKLIVTTDKPCQGVIEKTINVSDKIFPYPDPFEDILNISLGNNISTKALVNIHSAISGKLVFSKQYTKPSVTLPLELSELRTGVYILTLSLDNSQSVFKILKK
jgi:hypothetical protein